MHLNWKALIALRTVIREGTLTAAANRLHRTQPALSRLMTQLENDVGFALFRREGRRLLPTAEGLTFYRETERAFAALEEIESTALDISKGRETPLRIIAQSHMVHGLLHEALGTFCVERPHFRFAIEIRQNEYISHWIANRLFDVGFTPERADHPQISHEALVRAPLYVMMPSTHRLASKAKLTVSQIAREPFIAVRPGAPLRERLEAFFAASGGAVTIRGETASAVSAGQLVAQGLGLAIADPFVANVFLGDSRLVIRPLAPRVEMEYFVLRAANHDARPGTEEFVDSVRKAAREISKRVSNYASR